MSEDNNTEETPVVDDGLIADPKLYEKLAIPYESVEEASKKVAEFYKEVCVLREKVGIPEMVIAFSVNVKCDDGEVKELHQAGFRGGKATDRLILSLARKSSFGAFFAAMIDEMKYLLGK